MAARKNAAGFRPASARLSLGKQKRTIEIKMSRSKRAPSSEPSPLTKHKKNDNLRITNIRLGRL